MLRIGVDRTCCRTMRIETPWLGRDHADFCDWTEQVTNQNLPWTVVTRDCTKEGYCFDGRLPPHIIFGLIAVSAGCGAAYIVRSTLSVVGQKGAFRPCV